MTDPTVLTPEPASIVVSYHPHYELGDCVSMRFDDDMHGPYILAFSPDVVEYLSTLFATSVQSPGLRALSDQMRAAQRNAVS